MDLARHRIAVAAAFATQGFVFIALTTRLPDLRERWDLSETELSGVLLLIVLLAGAGSVVAERLAARRASATVLRGGLLAVAVGVVVLSLAPVLGVYLVGTAAYGLGLGVVDAATNMQGVALEHRYGRPVLPSLHGAWTAGGVLGAGLTLATGSSSLAVLAVLAVVPFAVAAAPFLRRDRGEAVAAAAGVAVPWRPIVLVGLGLVVFYMVDTAAQTWGAVYLDDVFATPSGLVALATFPYLLASLALRLAGDRLVARFGAAPVLRVGAVVGCAGLALVALAPSWPLAVVGFTVAGAGVAVVAPLSFTAAARIAGQGDGAQARVDAVVARFNLFNYAGALLGAVLTGVVGRDSLRVGFLVPTVLVLALLPLARAFREPARPTESAQPS